MKKIFFSIVLAAVVLILPQSCSKDFLEVQPTNSIAETSVFTTTDNAWAALNGIHRMMYAQNGPQRASARMDEAGQSGMMIQIEVLGEDVVPLTTGNGWFIAPARWLAHTSETGTTPYFAYRFYYRLISNANMIVNAIDNADGPTADKNAIKGQALAYRAWAHYQMVQLFGKRYDWTATPNTQPGIPIMLDNTFDGGPRATVEDVYVQIRQDLDQAITLLEGMAWGSRAKSHIHQRAAKGIRARVALTTGEWTTAIQMAQQARQGMSLMSQSQVLEGFSNIGNPEYIWGSEVIADQTTFFHSFYAFMSYNFSSTFSRTNPLMINNTLYEQMGPADIRRELFADTNVYPNNTHPKLLGLPGTFVKTHMHAVKFEAVGGSDSRGDVPYMRVAEMYLIEAEAKARSGDYPGAQQTLYDFVSVRDDEYVMSTNTGQALIDEILIHRRIELWGEGQRFFDLKRTNSPLVRTGTNANPAISVRMEVPAGHNDWQWKIPRAEIDANPFITDADQNPS
jgi:starch-binding outer membrane protein, SusD/RagB family